MWQRREDVLSLSKSNIIPYLRTFVISSLLPPTPLPYLPPTSALQSQSVVNLHQQVIVVTIESSFWSRFTAKDWTSAFNNQTCPKTWKTMNIKLKLPATQNLITSFTFLPAALNLLRDIKLRCVIVKRRKLPFHPHIIYWVIPKNIV